MKIAIIGGGISGIASAQILKKNGHDPIIFERSAAPGGVWAQAYPDVHHVFRTPCWMLQEYILGIHFTKLLFCRFGLVMMRSWVQPSSFEHFLHHKLPSVVHKFWDFVAFLLKREILKHQDPKDPASLQRLKTIIPQHSLMPDVGAKTALAPETYAPLVGRGQIIPHHADLLGFEKDGLRLSNEEHLPCDLVLLCLGFQTPSFPYLPEKYQVLLEEEGGCQLYRHLIHPRIPNLAFAGFNHGFMHVPTVEIGTQWICAVIDGQIKLPDPNEMEASMHRVAQWKQANMHYDPARAYGTSTRFQQYIDVLLKELGLSPVSENAQCFGRSVRALQCPGLQRDQ